MILETPTSGGGARRRRRLLDPFLTGLVLILGTTAGLAQPLTFDMVVVNPTAHGDDKETADIDGDGDADGIHGGLSLAWYPSNGAARTFAAAVELRAAAPEFTTDMSVGDVDSDGDVDLIVADGNGGNNVRWFENPRIDPPGPGSDPTDPEHWAEHEIGAHGDWAHDFEVGLIDAGPALDVLTMGHGQFRIHFQNSPTDWDTVSFAQFGGDGSPAIADIDGDGDRDIFVPGGWIESPQGDRRNPASWIFHPITDSNPGGGPAAIAFDVDRDGRVDLVTCPQHSTGTLAWFKNPANPESAAWTRRVISASAGSHHLRAGDFDGDSLLDLLTGLELGAITVWRITGAPGAVPTFTAFPVGSPGGHNAAFGDFDGNGLLDVWSSDYLDNPPLRAYFNGPNVIFRDGFETGNTSKWALGS